MGKAEWPILKITDFGVSERHDDFKEMDGALDVLDAGIILYSMIAGQFHDSMRDLKAALREDRLEIPQMAKAIGNDPVLAGMLAKDDATRWTLKQVMKSEF